MIKILNNQVLVLPDYEHFNSTVVGDERIEINTNYEKEFHMPSSGVVVKAPSILSYTNLPEDRDAMLYDTEMKLMTGDRVIFGYNLVEEAIKHGRCLGAAVYVKYDEIFCAIRGQEIIMLNGYVIVEAQEDHNPAGDLAVPEYLQSVNHYQSGKIVKVGDPIKRYRMYPELGGDNPGELAEGDKVLFHMQYSIPLQYQMHSVINSQKELYRMQQKDISAIIV